MASNIFKEIEVNNISSVRRIISVFPSAIESRRNKDSRTPLHIAVSHGHAAIATELLAHSAAHDSADKDGNTALHIACELGNLEVAVVLLAGAAHSESSMITLSLSHITNAKTLPTVLQPNLEVVVVLLTGANPPVILHGHIVTRLCPKIVDAEVAYRARTEWPTRIDRCSRISETQPPAPPVAGAKLPGGSTLSGMVAAPPVAVAKPPGGSTLSGMVADVQQLQEEMRDSAEASAEVAAVQKETGEQLRQAMEVIHAQASRLEDLESRLMLQEQRRTDDRHHSEVLVSRLTEWEAAQKKESELQQSISCLTTEQLSLQSSVQDMNLRLESLAMCAGSPRAPKSPTRPFPDLAHEASLDPALNLGALHQLVQDQVSLWQAHSAQLEDLKNQVQQKESGGAMDSLRQQVEDLKSQVQQVQLGESVGTMDSLRQQVEDLKSQVQQVQLGGSGGTMDSLRQQVEDLKSQVQQGESGVAMDSLRQQVEGLQAEVKKGADRPSSTNSSDPNDHVSD
eukprot:gene22061-29126_t